MRTNKEFCPYCNSILQGDPIPKQSQKAYAATHFTRKIRISNIEADKIVKWGYPDCRKEWKQD
ncbi:hypothetical protein [Bacillus cereus]